MNVRIEHAADVAGVSPLVVKAVAWQETGWTHQRSDGSLVTHVNRDKDGKAVSTDVGIMQVNSLAHANAFPKVATLDGNLLYGSRLVGFMLDRYGSGGLWHYNGGPAYQRAIEHHVAVQPWTVEIWRDHVSGLKAELGALQRSLAQKESLHTTLQARAAAASTAVERDRNAVESAADKAAETRATRALETSTRALESAHKKLDAVESDLAGSRARLAELPALIEQAQNQMQAEVSRVTAAEASYAAQSRAHLRGETSARPGRVHRAGDAGKVVLR